MCEIPTDARDLNENEEGGQAGQTTMRMVATSPPAALAAASLPPLATFAAMKPCRRPGIRSPPAEIPSFGFLRMGMQRDRSSTRPRAGLTEIEPDLGEDPHDRWRTNGVSALFASKLCVGDFWEAVVAEYQAAEPPTGFQDKPHNFEPQIYNMDRAARDKLIADYNSMDIWDFNEKYGELWDFTVKRDDIVKL
ncbi:hypothetical protein BHM03_00039702 [Ensete ventricosum]|nr:hypothetical protein BHM03_00039702 [Ensete ventricosum]